MLTVEKEACIKISDFRTQQITQEICALRRQAYILEAAAVLEDLLYGHGIDDST